MASRIFYQTHISPMLRLKGEAAEIFLTLQSNQQEGRPFLLNISTGKLKEQDVILFAGLLMVNRSKFESELVKARKDAENALARDSQSIAAKISSEKSNDDFEIQWRLNAQQAFELEQYTRVLGHDIREPLRKIILFSGMLAQSSETNALYDQKTLLDKIFRSTQILSQLADNLQAFVYFNAQEIVPEQHDIRSAFAFALERCVLEFTELRITAGITGNLQIFADRHQIESLFYFVLLTTIHNRTLDFLSLTIELDSLTRNRFLSGAGRYDFTETGRIRVVAADFSFGQKNVRKFADLFKNMKAGSDSSFYLSVVKKITDQNDGEVEFNGDSEKGGIFTFYFPLS